MYRKMTLSQSAFFFIIAAAPGTVGSPGAPDTKAGGSRVTPRAALAA
jgi:hypothetical protein